MFRILALLPILAVAAHAGNPGRLRLARQTAPATCTAPCQTLTTSLSSASSGGFAAICNNDILNEYGSCYGCQVKSGELPQIAGQQIIDTFTNNCNAAGHPLGSLTVAADGSTTSGSSGAASVSDAVSAPTASGAASGPAASGAASGAATDAASGPAASGAAGGAASGAAGAATGAAGGATSGAAGPVASGSSPVPTSGSSAGSPAGGSTSTTPQTGGALKTSASTLVAASALVFLSFGLVL
ncbi:hypothetical protein B0H16DRAFT_1892032 [Mycena metata]|uniref:Uncharacterized protein n=1 Tax=Mycena metata TaxID=1033252 RepID=A0AAD7I8B2_9AGAR|nr:hypothetical protein B0H16DRAFT_1892032 [Mycena metata]